MSGSRDYSVRVWGNLGEAQQGGCLAVLQGHTKPVTIIQLADSFAASASWDQSIVRFDSCLTGQENLGPSHVQEHGRPRWAQGLDLGHAALPGLSDDSQRFRRLLHQAVGCTQRQVHGIHNGARGPGDNASGTAAAVPTLQMEGNVLVTGSLDSTVRGNLRPAVTSSVWDTRKMAQSVAILQGHQDAVCAIHMVYPTVRALFTDGPSASKRRRRWGRETGKFHALSHRSGT